MSRNAEGALWVIVANWMGEGVLVGASFEDILGPLLQVMAIARDEERCQKCGVRCCKSRKEYEGGIKDRRRDGIVCP